jgi:hypothetical protein
MRRRARAFMMYSGGPNGMAGEPVSSGFTLEQGQ